MKDRLRAAITIARAECLTAACVLLCGCTGARLTGGYQPPMTANVKAGKALLQSYGCGACHVIPGVPAADGMVGPPLYYFSRRTMIAGELPNSPENLVRWIENPPAVEPGTAMPNLGVPNEKAKDMAAYLYTLR